MEAAIVFLALVAVSVGFLVAFANFLDGDGEAGGGGQDRLNRSVDWLADYLKKFWREE